MAVILGLVVAGFATTSGFDRDRAFYLTVLIVIASYYSLFDAMGASRYSTLEIEIAIGLVFSAFAVFGLKRSMWLSAAGIAGHGFCDFFVDHALVTNPGVPVWCAGFCGTIDIVLGGWLAICLWKTPESNGGSGTKWSHAGRRVTPAECLPQAGFPHRCREEQQNILNCTRKERL